MDWLPAISSTSLLALILWLSKNLIITRLTNAVKHEYDEKIEKIKTELKHSEELFKSELKAKESQIEALRNGALSNLSGRQSAVFNHQLNAIEEIWEAVSYLSTHKISAIWFTIIRFKSAIKAIKTNEQFKGIILATANNNLDQDKLKKAIKARPFLSPIVWAYYSAYQSIIVYSVIRLQMLQKEIDMDDMIDTSSITELVKSALPNHKDYIDQNGVDAFYFLLDELELKILDGIQSMLKGEELDQVTLKKAANIIKQSEELSREVTASSLRVDKINDN